MRAAQTSQAVASATTEGQGIVATGQIVALVTFANPAVPTVRSTKASLAATTEGLGIVANSQVVVLAAFRTGTMENLKNRAWSYTLDGHTFYVLTLGEQGTFVYDFTTKQWNQPQTQGLVGWNMELGVTWKGDIIAGDQQNPIIWRLTPDAFLDDGFKVQKRRVTGVIPVRQRDFISCFAFRLTASVGKVDVPITAPATVGKVTLSYSDDQGVTFTKDETILIDVGNTKQQLQWLSLGTIQQPGRVFRIEDEGGIKRISGADAELDGGE